jgi:hypothetical protein
MQGVVMIFSKRMMFFSIVIMALALSATVLWVSCDSSSSDDADGGDEYPRDTINVDYNGSNNAVFFDFSTGTKTVLPHDFFDIAISGKMTDPIIIANSGSYGSGVQVYKTASTDISADFSSSPGADAVKEYTFKTGETLYSYQTAENPLGELGMPASNVMLIKVQYKTTDTAQYFKVVFSMTMGATQSFNIQVVPGLGSGTANTKTINAAITGLTNGYGWLYFKLVGTDGPRVLNNGTTWLETGATAVPLAANWDILATRTTELQSEDGSTVSTQMPVVSRSSVLLNIYKNVAAKTISGKLIDQVPSTEFKDTGLSDVIDAIGYGWYSMGSGMPPAFSVAENTYVIKTVEEKYAKFQPESFYGVNKESFVMDFSYYYQN